MTVFFSSQYLRNIASLSSCLQYFQGKIFCHNFLLLQHTFFPIKMPLRLLLSLVESHLIIMFLDAFFFLFLCSIFQVLDLCILCIFFNLKRFQALFLHILSLSPYLSIFFWRFQLLHLY